MIPELSGVITAIVGCVGVGILIVFYHVVDGNKDKDAKNK